MSYAPFVEKLYILDNSEPVVQAVPRNFLDTGNVEYIPFGENKGIGYALNFGAQKAVREGATWLLTMDQDSVFVGNSLEKLIYLACHCDLESTGIVSPCHWISGPCPEVCDKTEEILVTMTSGNLVNLYAWQKVGGWREDLFIDAVDHEFCLRLRRQGLKIVQYHGAVLLHGLGKITEHCFLGKKFYTTNHSYVRRYYMTRNGLLVAREFFRDYPGFSWQVLRSIFVDAAKIVIAEEDKLRKLKMMIRGFRDFVLGRTGKVYLP